ncbi:hypothetical protein C0991_007899, partial [Blastosporella zonata]
YSIGCMKSLMLIGQNSEASTCLKPAQLFPVMVGAGNGPESVIGYLDTWLGSMCGAPACSDNLLYEVLTNLTRDCSEEFGLGGPAAQVTQTIATLQAGYQTARKVACLKDTNSAGINCVTGTLRNIESLTGALSLNDTNIASIAKYVTKGFPKSVICTNCVKAAYTMMNQALPGSLFSASDTKDATTLCGASFAGEFNLLPVCDLSEAQTKDCSDGIIPPGIVSTALDASTAKVTTSIVSSSTLTPTPSSTRATPSPTVTPTSTPTPTKKNSALGHGSSLPSIVFIALSGLVAAGVEMV